MGKLDIADGIFPPRANGWSPRRPLSVGSRSGKSTWQRFPANFPLSCGIPKGGIIEFE